MAKERKTHRKHKKSYYLSLNMFSNISHLTNKYTLIIGFAEAVFKVPRYLRVTMENLSQRNFGFAVKLA